MRTQTGVGTATLNPDSDGRRLGNAFTIMKHFDQDKFEFFSSDSDVY